MLKIESRSNKKIKYAAALAESAKRRAENNEFLLEGARLCRDAAQSGIAVRFAFFTDEALRKYGDYINVIKSYAAECFELAPHVADRLCETSAGQGIFCVCTAPERKTGDDIDINGKYIALENIQDPANLGAICRTAEALGLTGLIISGGCDIYNPKALRAAMGTSLRINIIICDSLPVLLKATGEKGMATFASTPDCGAADIREAFSGGGAIVVVGNEGAGISDETANACGSAVTIPMLGKAESLNASAAAAILMWELMRK